MAVYAYTVNDASTMRFLIEVSYTSESWATQVRNHANDFVIPAATVNWIADLAVEHLANFTRK